jgi:hypothetical protein
MSVYNTNRAKMSLDELKKYDGQWVAFSMDGSRVLASAVTLPELEERLAAVGEDPEQVAFERIEFEEGYSYLGGVEFNHDPLL